MAVENGEGLDAALRPNPRMKRSAPEAISRVKSGSVEWQFQGISSPADKGVCPYSLRKSDALSVPTAFEVSEGSRLPGSMAALPSTISKLDWASRIKRAMLPLDKKRILMHEGRS